MLHESKLFAESESFGELESFLRTSSAQASMKETPNYPRAIAEARRAKPRASLIRILLSPRESLHPRFQAGGGSGLSRSRARMSTTRRHASSATHSPRSLALPLRRHSRQRILAASRNRRLRCALPLRAATPRVASIYLQIRGCGRRASVIQSSPRAPAGRALTCPRSNRRAAQPPARGRGRC